MATTVNVLCPNGRRQNVKISANTKILQILEDVCKKQGLIVEEHELQHGRNILDLTIPVRYSNLPNNAKLEIVKSSKTRLRTESAVVVALQLENGVRRQHEFQPSTSLWEILNHFENLPDSENLSGTKTSKENSQVMHPVIIYMREEVAGERALRATTLRKLGLTSGRTILRLIHRGIDEANLAEITDQVEQQEAKRQKLDKEVTPGSISATASLPSATIGDTTCKKDTAPVQAVSSMPMASSSIEMTTETDASQPSFPVVTRSIFPTRQENPRPQKQPQHVVFPPMPQPTFVDFKFPEETKGKDVYQNEFSDFKEEEYKPCDRETVVYSLTDHQRAVAAASSDDLPDDFFEVTETDLKKMMIDLQNKVRLCGEQPLVTKAMRQQQLEDQMSKYSHAIIRVQFPDKVILQGVFRPRETVRALYKYVEGSLADSSMPFYLFTSPPKKELKDQSQLLIQAQLVPAVLVYFGSQVKKDSYLASDLLSNAKSVEDAEEVVKKCLFGNDSAIDNPNDKVQPAKTTTVKASGREQVTTSGGAKKAANVPKWFKMGKK